MPGSSASGQRSTREDKHGGGTTRAGGRASTGGGASGSTPPSDDEGDCDHDEEPRDILAVCRHGNRLGIAAVSCALPVSTSSEKAAVSNKDVALMDATHNRPT